MTREFRARQAFIEEAREELLPELESALLELGANPDRQDQELVNRVFRALHTLKGSGAMFGFDRLSELAHEVETVFDCVRCGLVRMNHPLVKLTLAAKDQFQLLVDDPEAVVEEAISDLMIAFSAMVPGEIQAGGFSSGQPTMQGNDQTSDWTAWHIRFKPRTDIFSTGTNPLFLLDELHGLGTARVIAHIDAVPLLDTLDPELCYTWWDILLATDKGRNAIQDVFIFVEQDCLLTITSLAETLHCGDEHAAFDSLTHLLLEKVKLTPEILQEVFADARTTDSGTTMIGTGRDKGDETAISDGRCKTSRRPVKTISSMRVQAAKLDQLVNLVGELVIAQTRLSRLAEEKEDQKLIEIAETIERLSSDLRENTLDIRMLPIGSSFGKFKRVVWDLSSRKGKEVELITEGAATELDKTVIERLDDPLVHLLRNSIDHGLESPEEREAAGKPRQGRIVFSAEHSGGNVIITISDDGRGIDLDLIRAKAVEKGFLPPEADPSEQELLKIIFEPGFSTAREVSDLSGRGVGMDVVKQNITALRGKVRITSDPGQGSTVRITLPLTLAIIDGLRVRIGREHFIVPLTVVTECLELNQSKNENARRERFINLRDQLVPFLSLREWFSINGRRPDREQVVIVSAEKKQVGLIVDEVVGLQQTVIKNLGEAYKDIPGVSGATIQGDGSLALILDVEPLVLKATEQSSARSG